MAYSTWHSRGLESEGTEGGLVETVAEGGWKFMVAWRNEELDAARHCQEKREANETRKVVIVHGSVELVKRYQLA